MKLFKAFFILCIAIMLFACGKKEEDRVLATVNGKAISQSQFDAYLKFKRVPETDEKRVQKLLDAYIEREALADVIEKEQLLDKAMIDAELNEFRKEMLISRYFETYLKDKVSKEAVQNYYNTHADEYVKEKMHVAHILIRTNKKMSETERKAKLTIAQEAYSKIRAGADFAKVAETYSEDRISAKKGGDLGWLSKGSIDKRFSSRAFDMQPGDISEPFETVFGFHIVKLIEAPKQVKEPFKAVAGNIRYQLRSQAKQAEVERLKELSKLDKPKN